MNDSFDLPHASIDIDIFCPDEESAICWAVKPTVDLPNEEQEDEERTGEVELEPGFSVEVGTANWVECDVELSDEGDYGDEHDEVRAVDTAGSFVWELVQGMTVVFPVSKVSCVTVT
jgi:hypothetical protein